jgi:DnaJ-class molecular chaperone
MDDMPDVRIVLCEACGGDGRVWTSRYGGNDPDVWDAGPCPVCEGTGDEIVEVQPIEMEDLEWPLYCPTA